MAMTNEQYLAARQQLDLLNKAIDDSPPEAKLVVMGIVELHDKVKRYERKHNISSD